MDNDLKTAFERIRSDKTLSRAQLALTQILCAMSCLNDAYDISIIKPTAIADKMSNFLLTRQIVGKGAMRNYVRTIYQVMNIHFRKEKRFDFSDVPSIVNKVIEEQKAHRANLNRLPTS